MNIDWIEYYVNAVKILEYKMYLKNVSFEPDSAVLVVSDSTGTETLSGACTLDENSMSILIDDSLTANVGDYTGVYTIIKSPQTYLKKIKIKVRDI